MSTVWRSRFRRDLLVLFVVSVLAASAASAAFAWLADHYFGKTINGLMGEYGQYDLFLQVRSDTVQQSRVELDRLIGERLPGAEVKAGPTLAGKSSFYVALPVELHRRDVFEGLDTLFATIPGWSGMSLLTEPRLTISAVLGGAQDMLIRRVTGWPEVSFAFARGGNVEVVLKSASSEKLVTDRIKVALKEYRLVEVRYAAGYTMEDALSAGGKVTGALQKKAGSGLVRDVTLAGSGDDYQYLMGTMIQMKRFLGYYAAVVTVDVTGDQSVHPGDQLVLQGGQQALITGEPPGEADVVVKIGNVGPRDARGIIVHGDSRSVARPEGYLLDGAGHVGRFVGMTQVRSQRDDLMNMLDESSKLVGQLGQISPEASSIASGAIDKLLGYSNLLADARQAQQSLKDLRDGLDKRDSASGQAALNIAMQRLDRASAELAGMSTSIDQLRSSVTSLSDAAGKLDGFNNRLSTVSRFLPAGTGIDRLLTTTRTLASISAGIADHQKSIDTLTENLREPLAAVDYWHEKVQRFETQAGDYQQLMFKSGDGRRQLDDMILVTGRTVDMLAKVDPTGAIGSLQGLTGGAGADMNLNDLSGRIADIRKSLPDLRDEEIGRSITVIDQYVGDQAFTGEKSQILTDQKLPMKTVNATVESVLGKEATVVALPVGALQPDFRGEVFRLLGQVRTSIAALLALVLGVAVFLLDQALVLSAMRREFDRTAGRRRGFAGRMLRMLESPHLYGAVVGAVWFPLTFAASGAALPVVGLWGAAIIGLAVGSFFAATCDRFNSVNTDEMLAGEALGLPFEVVMREIVIPSGRPGLLMWLNRRRLIMK